ncbi:unnamed protein product [Arabidopsis thaliana]|uniref:Uncharacterized protein n=1 Tax=Arabidopsis thaliana TaxID=3702 RepID=A0A5S9YH19_ARATH|nr:unnamed protein product [Arabidopsis thaliana]
MDGEDLRKVDADIRGEESGVHAPPFEILGPLKRLKNAPSFGLRCEIARLRFEVEIWELFYYFLTTL